MHNNLPEQVGASILYLKDSVECALLFIEESFFIKGTELQRDFATISSAKFNIRNG